MLSKGALKSIHVEWVEYIFYCVELDVYCDGLRWKHSSIHSYVSIQSDIFHSIRLRISPSIYSIYITYSSIWPSTNLSKHPSLHLSLQSSTVYIYSPIYSWVSFSFFLCILQVDLTKPPSSHSLSISIYHNSCQHQTIHPFLYHLHILYLSTHHCTMRLCIFVNNNSIYLHIYMFCILFSMREFMKFHFVVQSCVV